MIKISKFGGSSVASAEQFKKVKAIVDADPDRKFVVVSAVGRRFDGDNKITDLLLLVNAHIQYHVDCTSLLADIEQRFVDIADELGVTWPVAEKFETFAKNIKKHSPEYIVSRGEWFTSHIMAEYLGLKFVDAADVIVFHHDGTVDIERTASRLKEVVVREGAFVLPGFYGATVDGSIKLFKRGGGDITGAIVARCINADLYENWTDVSGFLSADPRVVDDPRSIRRITFDEMRELSYAGFGVFHDEAVVPAFRAGIPINIRNTNHPDRPGTRVLPRREADTCSVVGIASDTGFVALYVDKYMMNREVGFGRRLLQILEDEGVSFEHMPSGIDNVSVVIRASRFDAAREARVVARIQAELKPDAVLVERDHALIMVVGEGMQYAVGMAARATQALAAAGVNIEMINQGASEISMMFGVRSPDRDRAVRALYQAFFA